MESIGEIQKVTKAMKLISVSKLRKAKKQLSETQPFFNEVEYMMADILSHSADIVNSNFDKRPDKTERTTAILIMTGDKGLSGGYDHNVFKKTEELLEQQKNNNPVLLVAGRMGREYFARKNYRVDEEFEYPVRNPSVHRAREMAQIITDRFRSGKYDDVYIVYTKMESALSLKPDILKLLPLDLEDLKDSMGISGQELHTNSMLNYEPSPHEVFKVLVPKYLTWIVYACLVEAFTSEQTARMNAMDTASSNAEDMLSRLNLYYNRARQAAITQEISEIVGGASAL
jgi:F-type H+-transporting ATPase subunit gamma